MLYCKAKSHTGFEARALNSMQARGAACHMITGDNWVTARMIAHRLGIRHVTAEVCHEPYSSALRNDRRADQTIGIIDRRANQIDRSTLRTAQSTALQSGDWAVSQCSIQ
jgi:magnesium-transporting ATPase (P-type)